MLLTSIVWVEAPDMRRLGFGWAPGQLPTAQPPSRPAPRPPSRHSGTHHSGGQPRPPTQTGAGWANHKHPSGTHNTGLQRANEGHPQEPPRPRCPRASRHPGPTATVTPRPAAHPPAIQGPTTRAGSPGPPPKRVPGGLTTNTQAAHTTLSPTSERGPSPRAATPLAAPHSPSSCGFSIRRRYGETHCGEDGAILRRPTR